MNTFRKLAFTAAALAVVMGSSAATSTADAGWRFKFSYGPKIHISTYNHCYQPYWINGHWQYVWTCAYPAPY